MNFIIADTFTDSLAKLTGEEQKAVKTTAFDLQINPAHPGMSFHKLDRARDSNFWSVRVNSDIRLIVHKTNASLLLCYVDHHDKAYEWAARRKIETHPKTGAAQLVEIRETVQEIVVPFYTQSEFVTSEPVIEPPLFVDIDDEELLGYGVPAEWLDDVRKATAVNLFALADHLPAEAAEALLELATGGKPSVPQPITALENPFDHPDAQRRFRILTNLEELQQALDYPWEKWTVFLHPEQRQWVEREYTGPARVSGSAGTGKTIVALHRAAFLARKNPDARVLLTTLSTPLANALKIKLNRLLVHEPRLAERIDVYAIKNIGLRLYKAQNTNTNIVSHKMLRQLLKDAASVVKENKFSLHFLLTEWDQIVDAWQLNSWEDYRDVVRLGRKTRLPEAQRIILWEIFKLAREELQARRLITHSEMFTSLANAMSSRPKPFDYVVVDEAQDFSVAHIRFFAAMGESKPNSLFFAGDLGQRILQQSFSWKSLGIDVRGRSRTLRINYRTSHQIRMVSDRLLGTMITDIDGNTEDRSHTISVFNGALPYIRSFPDESEEIDAIRNWITEKTESGLLPHEFGIFVRSENQLDRAIAAVAASGLAYVILDDNIETLNDHVSISTMHLVKGLEFRAVAVMACDDEVIPLQERIETVGDESDLQEVYDTERQLLYVACTRARDHLIVTSITPASEFLDDLQD